MKDFRHEYLSDNFVRIIESSDIAFYLVIGEEKCILFDSGFGIGNVKEYIEKNITSKPIIMILSHGHLDHIGAACLFDEVYMNERDLPVYEIHKEKRLGRGFENLLPAFEGTLRPLHDYDEFDLGNEKVLMIPVKGHTPGMMVPLLKKNRIAIFGDACGVGVLLFDQFSSCVSEYLASLKNLKKYEDQYDRIVRNHGTFASEKDLLDNVMECCELILAGKDDHHKVESHGMVLYEAKERDAKENRIDGKFGDILYAMDKAK